MNSTKIKNYTILYFHGHDSFLSGEKKIILQRFGTVILPLIDYKETGSINKVIDLYAEKIIADVDIVIGSSMGGLVAYHVSQSMMCHVFYGFWFIIWFYE